MTRFNKLNYTNSSLKKKNFYLYPLLENGFSKQDLEIGSKIIKTGLLTMGAITKKFEINFAKKLGCKYALMTNSGSSANLLAAYAACNPLRKIKFKKKDEALIPALCWPTSLWPLYQTGLKIKFIDIDPTTLNVNAEDLIKNISKRTKVIMLINILGTATDVKKITSFAKKKKIIVIEDNCEALGAKLNSKYLGTLGDFGTFSFFYSHQITSGEGGMITCNNKEDYKILLSLRSHGWSRGVKSDYINYSKKYPNLDPRYIFINQGFNLRPTEMQAGLAQNQFKRLKKFIINRTKNREKIIHSLKKNKKWNNQFEFISVPKNISPSFMGLPVLVNKRFKNKKKNFINYLEQQGIETRPILSGSFVNQPAAKLFKLKKNNKKKLMNVQIVEDLGFLIGLHTKTIDKKHLNLITNCFLNIDKI
jgi:CDP-6-deoxy-D-xylo-4-hexulose-3-dehydrase